MGAMAYLSLAMANRGNGGEMASISLLWRNVSLNGINKA